MAEPGPGDRQPGETAKAYRAFRIYLEQGPARSTGRVGEEVGHRSSKQAEKWCSRWRWRDRVAEFEAKAIGKRDDAHLAEIAKRARRQAHLAQLYQEAMAIFPTEVMRRVQAAQQGDEEALAALAKMPLGELLQAIAPNARAHHRVVVTERLALGMTTDQPGEELPRAEAAEHASRLSDAELDDDLAPVDELAAKRRQRAA